LPSQLPPHFALRISALGRLPRPTLSVVTGQHMPRSQALTLDELAQRCHAVPVAEANELALDIWESDEELDAFLADMYASRNASYC
jgi:hypothetical protein